MVAIETDRLTKHYGSFAAVRDLSFSVQRGSITGFLGQNGAGKSSTLKMLLGMMRPSSGTGHIFDLRIDDPDQSLAIRRRTAFVSEDKRLYDYMTVGQIIRFTRSFFPGWRHDVAEQMLADFDLPLARPIRKLSKGMRTQTALLLALARGSELLILDEPTEGLDPLAIEKVLRLIVARTAEGATVFFSSHQISEVEQIADRVLIINDGQLVVDAPLDGIREQYRHVQLVFDEVAPATPRDWKIAGIERVQIQGRTALLLTSCNNAAIVAHARAIGARSVDVTRVTLRDVFLDVLKAAS